MKKLVLLRHSQSLWNLENKFTGWTDVDLCDQGIQEAHKVGQVLKAEGYTFNVAYTSVLKRSVRTLWIALDEMDLMWIPVYRSWRLNERHYGALQGLNKKATVEKHGALQVHIWRRSYAIQPPALTLTDPRHPRFDQRYVHLKEEEMPCTESLKDTLSRVLPYWNKVIVPRLKEGKLILISAHGNSLRALVKYLDNISNDDIMELNVPTGVPLVYEFDDELKVRTHYYIGSEKEIKT